MNREIKFRGKRADNLKWVYGSYYEHMSRQICPIGDESKKEDIKHLIILSGFADWNMPRPLQALEVNPETVGQFIGLKDKNGNEIYEGDIVEFIDLPNGDDELCIGEIIFEEFGWHFTNSGLECYEPESVEVIGNIYENPELLEVEK